MIVDHKTIKTSHALGRESPCRATVAHYQFETQAREGAVVLHESLEVATEQLAGDPGHAFSSRIMLTRDIFLQAETGMNRMVFHTHPTPEGDAECNPKSLQTWPSADHFRLPDRIAPIARSTVPWLTRYASAAIGN